MVISRRYGLAIGHLRRLVSLASVSVLVSGCVFLPLRMMSRISHKADPVPIAVIGPTTPPPDVTAALRKIVQAGAPGVTAIVMRDGQQLYRIDVGSIGPETQYAVASASKWMTAALVMTVVDQGLLSLDSPLGDFAGFRGSARDTTLRELLAQTSGEGSLWDGIDIRQDPRMTLAESAADVAGRPLQDPPGRVFRYGGPGFQVAGALVEAVTHRRWADLFAERIARPLGMTHTYWEHLPDHGVTPADTLNPLLQGGVVTTADDYMRFLTMLAQRGRFGDRHVLSARAVDAMETAQTLGKPMAYVPPGAPAGTQYALGNWCERWITGGHCTLVSSPGAFGTVPWIDRENGRYGIFFMHERLPRVLPYVVQARATMMAQGLTREPGSMNR